MAKLPKIKWSKAMKEMLVEAHGRVSSVVRINLKEKPTNRRSADRIKQ